MCFSRRAGVLGLMLHSTYNHEVMERITGKANENGKLKEGSWRRRAAHGCPRKKTAENNAQWDHCLS